MATSISPLFLIRLSVSVSQDGFIPRLEDRAILRLVTTPTRPALAPCIQLGTGHRAGKRYNGVGVHEMPERSHYSFAYMTLSLLCTISDSLIAR